MIYFSSAITHPNFSNIRSIKANTFSLNSGTDSVQFCGLNKRSHITSEPIIVSKPYGKIAGHANIIKKADQEPIKVFITKESMLFSLTGKNKDIKHWFRVYKQTDDNKFKRLGYAIAEEHDAKSFFKFFNNFYLDKIDTTPFNKEFTGIGKLLTTARVQLALKKKYKSISLAPERQGDNPDPTVYHYKMGFRVNQYGDDSKELNQEVQKCLNNGSEFNNDKNRVTKMILKGEELGCVDSH